MSAAAAGNAGDRGGRACASSLASVLGDGAPAAGQRAARLAALLDPGFLAEAGWNPVTWLLAPETEHRLIRWDGSRLRQGLLPGRDRPPRRSRTANAR